MSSLSEGDEIVHIGGVEAEHIVVMRNDEAAPYFLRQFHCFGGVHVGRDVECITLARAVKAFIERRVFINGERTVVLR